MLSFTLGKYKYNSQVQMLVSMDCGKEHSLADFLNFLSPDLLSKAKFILLVGSYSEGLANSSSDVDLYAYCEDGYSGALHNTEKMNLQPGKRVEVSVIDRSFLEHYLKKANAENYDGFSVRDVEIIHKLLKGKVLLGESAYLDLTHSTQRDSFGEKVIKYFHDFSINHYDDMVGAHLEGDHASAALFSRFLADSAVDTALAAAGDTYPKLKWRLKRAARALSSTINDEYLWVTFNSALASDADYARHCLHALCLYRKLLFGVWFGKHQVSEDAGQSSDDSKQFITETWVFPYISHGTRLIKHQSRIYHVELLAQLIAGFAFQPRPHHAIISMGVERGYTVTDVNTAMDSLISMGLLTQVAA